MNWDSWAGHSLSLGALFASFANIVPAIMSIPAAVWFLFQIYESRTFQHWKNNRRSKRQAKRLAKLRAKEKVTLAQIEALERLRHARSEARDLVEEAKSQAAAMVVREAADTASKIP